MICRNLCRETIRRSWDKKGARAVQCVSLRAIPCRAYFQQPRFLARYLSAPLWLDVLCSDAGIPLWNCLAVQGLGAQFRRSSLPYFCKASVL
jgi:hypothetical protein